MELDRIENLIDKFTSHEQTHPVLSKIWLKSLNECKLKIETIKKILDQGEALVEKLPNEINDPNITTILLLITILSDYNGSSNAI